MQTASLRIFNHLKHWALIVRRDLHALYLAARDPRVPWYAKAVAIFVPVAKTPIDEAKMLAVESARFFFVLRFGNGHGLIRHDAVEALAHPLRIILG